MERLTGKEKLYEFVSLEKYDKKECQRKCASCEIPEEALRKLKEYEELRETEQAAEDSLYDGGHNISCLRS